MEYKYFIKHYTNKILEEDKSYKLLRKKEDIYKILKANNNDELAKELTNFFTEEKISLLFKEGRDVFKFTSNKLSRQKLYRDYINYLLTELYYVLMLK